MGLEVRALEDYVTEKKPLWKSKKWIAAVIAAIIPVINSVTGLDMDPAEVITVVIPLVAYVFSQGIVDSRH